MVSLWLVDYILWFTNFLACLCHYAAVPICHYTALPLCPCIIPLLCHCTVPLQCSALCCSSTLSLDSVTVPHCDTAPLHTVIMRRNGFWPINFCKYFRLKLELAPWIVFSLKIKKNSLEKIYFFLAEQILHIEHNMYKLELLQSVIGANFFFIQK